MEYCNQNFGVMPPAEPSDYDIDTFSHSPIFTNCSFVGCDLRGSFISARFESCTFEDCKTGDDNLGGKTIWEGSKAISCTLIRTTLPESVETS